MRVTAGLVHSCLTLLLLCASMKHWLGDARGLYLVILGITSNVKLGASVFNVQRYFNEASAVVLQSAKAKHLCESWD